MADVWVQQVGAAFPREPDQCLAGSPQRAAADLQGAAAEATVAFPHFTGAAGD